MSAANGTWTPEYFASPQSVLFPRGIAKGSRYQRLAIRGMATNIFIKHTGSATERLVVLARLHTQIKCRLSSCLISYHAIERLQLEVGQSQPEMSHHMPSSSRCSGQLTIAQQWPCNIKSAIEARMLRRKLTKIELKPEDREEVGCILYLSFHSSLHANMFD